MNLTVKAFVCFLLFFSYTSEAQELKLPAEMERALEKGTRTLKGVPGDNYWANSSDYNLDVKVVFEGDTTWIVGSGRIIYHNNSPQQLNIILLRSYPDMYAASAIRDFYFGGAVNTELVEYSDVVVNGDTIPSQMMYQRRTSTNIALALNKPLASGEEAVIDIKWKYMMHPQINIRQGVYADKAVFIAYWYPQVAVFDDMYGWDLVDYTGLAEFYNDFNNYDVKVTLPADYYAWAGGVLQNPGAVYSEEIIKKIAEASKSDDVVKILTSENMSNSFGSAEEKTWHFKSEQTPDFTFAASRSHLWDASSIEVGDGRRVLVSAVYPPASKFYSECAVWARESVEYLSYTCPGVPYPWPSMTVFNSLEGGGAMESPMMVNSGDQQTPETGRGVVFHEIAHTIMPFYLGANERRYAWMDEGWASYQDTKWSNGDHGSSLELFKPTFDRVSGSANDLPLMTPTWMIKDNGSETFHAYVRSSQAFLTIENQMGAEKMNQAWKLFAERWNGKHPSPWDLFATFSEVAGENLEWLFYPWYYKFASSDLAISDVDIKKGQVTVENTGGLPLPVYLTVKYSDGSTEELYRKPDSFKSSDKCIVDIPRKKGIESIELGNKYFLDRDISNNSWEK